MRLGFVVAVVSVSLTLTSLAGPPKEAKPEAGRTPDAAPSTKVGDNVLSFNGIISISRQNGKITRFHIGNMDDDMKSGYDIVLDAKGKELAKSKIMAVTITGRVEKRKGKTVLVVQKFKKFTNRK
jgi:hypothetical protein